MEKLNLSKGNLKKFGITMAVAFLIISLLLVIRHKHNIFPVLSTSFIFFIFALMMPDLLRPIYVLWMRLTLMLSWINTRLILLIIFYLIFMPVGLTMRVFKVDLLDRKIDKRKESYWRQRDKNALSYKRQF